MSEAIVVTGGAGFIGSNLVKALVAERGAEVVVVDNLTEGEKFRNIADCDIADYWDQDEFLDRLRADEDLPGAPRAIFHQGACSDTTEWDGRYLMRNNYEYSKVVLEYCRRRGISCIYASSAAVYGGGSTFREEPNFEQPLNVYGYSKHLFDQFVRRLLPQSSSQIVGLRYFNVYGPRENHKGKMASVAYHLHRQLADGEVVKLFEGSDGYADGEQRRDFVYVDDVVAVNLWFLDHPQCSGVFNVGTGRSQTFNDVARAVIEWHGRGRIEYIPFPESLVGSYQSFTEADVESLRSIGFDRPFLSVEDGVSRYLDVLESPSQVSK